MLGNFRTLEAREMKAMVRQLVAGGVTCVCVDPLWDKMYSSGLKATHAKMEK